MEELGVLVGKDKNEADAKLNTAQVQKCYTWTQGTLQLMPFLIPLKKKKREDIAGGKFGPSLRPTKLDCYS